MTPGDDTRSSLPVIVNETGTSNQSDLFSQVGGSDTFDRLVRKFYDEIQNDAVLWPMYPQHDLDGSIHRLSTFLQQYWGGPTTYSDERGHPRLRARHSAFTVNPDARDRWLAHMRTALDSIELAPLHDATLWDYLDRAAHSLVNTFKE